MKTIIDYKNKTYQIDLANPLDISIPLRDDKNNPTAWYLSPPTISPVKDGDFVGSIKRGASTNFNSILFNPHAHGTHTECIGHITEDFYSINDCLKRFFFYTEVISVYPEKWKEDSVITKQQIEKALKNPSVDALVIRTLPNERDKLTKQYSHTNPPYLLEGAAAFIRECGIKHLLIDLPSVDKEKDNGALLAHKAFWDFHREKRLDATITEFIYVPSIILDGMYFLNLQIASFVNDASPSKPILYKVLSP
ncbi:cyclase family protein [Galbibacter mesophilus]|uniref:cyclase family protein n=1 Tax=Galbibacter mesophilus TaxID=379069 RepID=UPI00191F6983|nr:cyclase family protein [Galbibacter mesophilus]MCM5662112.1 cyclase family protein [Galbibacter mesophilus]